MKAETDPSEETISKSSRMEEMKKLIQQMGQEMLQLAWSSQERMCDKEHLLREIEWLKEREKWKRNQQRQKVQELTYLKRDLDKLCSSNKSYRNTEFVTEEGIDVHNLHFLMRHGTNSLEKERKYLKEINEKHRKVDTDSTSSLQDIYDRIRKLGRQQFLPCNHNNWELLEKKIQEEKKLLKLAQEEAFAKAPVNGKTWNSLRAKQDIIHQIEVIEKNLNEEREENKQSLLKIRAEMSILKRELKATDKDISNLEKQRLNLRIRKHHYNRLIE